MPKILTDLLLQIDVGSELTASAILSRIDAERHKALAGNLDRSQFETAVFGSGDLSDLPILHLTDHRVRMPDAIIDRIIADGRTAVADMLQRMMCSVEHKDGAYLVAGAVGVYPRSVAADVMALEKQHGVFVRHCLAGRHGDAIAIIRKQTNAVAGRSMRDLLVSCAITYGALDLQLIAARQRAFGRARFAVDDGETGDTMAALLAEMRALMVGIKKANEGVQGDDPLKGRRPDLIAGLKPKAEHILARLLTEAPGVTEASLLAQLRATMATLSALTDNVSQKVEDALADDKPAANRSTTAEMAGLRERISTAWAGVSGATQLAYASMRLIAFRARIGQAVDRLIGGKSLKPGDYFSEGLPGWRNEKVEALLVVSRSILWRSPEAEPAFGWDGREYDLDELIKDYHSRKQCVGEDLIKRTRLKFGEKWLKSRAALPPHDLAAPALWDILPDFRFTPTLGLSTGSALDLREPRGYVTKPHQPSPQYRAPKKAYRPC